MPTEADTCRTLITPKLIAAGWDSDPRSIAEQRYFTDGRIIVRGDRAERRRGKRADYILRFTRDFPIAVVEAKSQEEEAATGLQQAKDYAEILKLQFAYATNGRRILEFDYITGLERELAAFPTPDGRSPQAAHPLPRRPQFPRGRSQGQNLRSLRRCPA